MYREVSLQMYIAHCDHFHKTVGLISKIVLMFTETTQAEVRQEGFVS
jgi:hypothetical protein